jgi:formate dehydrogenase major subunit
MSAAYYLLIAGHDVTIFERDPEPGGMLRYGIPQYRLPKVEVLDAEYQSVYDLGGQMVCNSELGKDFTIDDLQNQGFDAVCVAIGCYETNKLGVPGEEAEGVLDGLEYLRIATLGLPYPGHKGTRVVVIGGGFTSMDCTRTSVRQGAKEVTLVYRRDMKDMPAANEVHEALEEGARAIFQAAPTRVVTDKNNKVTGVEFQRMAMGAPDASGRRRPEPVAGTEFIIDCDRVLLAIGQGPQLDWLSRGADGMTATKNRRLAADAVTFSTGRKGVFGTGDVRVGAATVVQATAEGRRSAYAIDAYLKGLDLDEIKTRQTLAEPQPEFLNIVPYTGEIKEPRYRLKAMPAEVRNKSYIEYEIPYTQQEAMAESKRCLQCTCEAIGYCDLRRQGIEYGTTLKTLEPERTGFSLRSVNENRFTGTNHDYIRDDSHAFILREPSRCIDCGRCANVCKEVVGAACYDFMRTGFDTLVTTPLDMSLNTTPCVSCGRCAETCPTGALMPKPRVLEKYEVDESRCILCGICVDACPYDALRCGPDFELAHENRADPQIDLLAISAIERDTEISWVRNERDWLERATVAGRRLDAGRMLPMLPAGVAGNGHGGNGHAAHAHAGNGHAPDSH